MQLKAPRKVVVGLVKTGARLRFGHFCAMKQSQSKTVDAILKPDIDKPLSKNICLSSRSRTSTADESFRFECLIGETV